MLSNVLTVHVFFVSREKSVQECSTRELCCQVLPPRVQTFSTGDVRFLRAGAAFSWTHVAFVSTFMNK